MYIYGISLCYVYKLCVPSNFKSISYKVKATWQNLADIPFGNLRKSGTLSSFKNNTQILLEIYQKRNLTSWNGWVCLLCLLFIYVFFFFRDKMKVAFIMHCNKPTTHFSSIINRIQESNTPVLSFVEFCVLELRDAEIFSRILCQKKREEEVKLSRHYVSKFL